MTDLVCAAGVVQRPTLNARIEAAREERVEGRKGGEEGG